MYLVDTKTVIMGISGTKPIVQLKKAVHRTVLLMELNRVIGLVLTV